MYTKPVFYFYNTVKVNDIASEVESVFISKSSSVQFRPASRLLSSYQNFFKDPIKCIDRSSVGRSDCVDLVLDKN